MVFIDLVKDLYTVNRGALVNGLMIMAYETPKKFRYGTCTKVHEGRFLSKTTEFESGVYQGCVIRSKLFTLIFDRISENALQSTITSFDHIAYANDLVLVERRTNCYRENQQIK